jgi:hypothetical protein
MQVPSIRELARRPVANSWLGIGILAVTMAGCEPMARPEVRLDCDAAERLIERDTFSPDYFPFELDPLSSNNDHFFCFADGSADGYPANSAPFPANGCPMPQVKEVNEGQDFCHGTNADPTRHKAAFLIQAGQHEFYGGEIGNWDWNSGGVPSSTDFVPDGIAFWARSDIQSDKFITVYLNNSQTGAPSDTVPGTTYSPTLAAKGREAGCIPGVGNNSGPSGVSVTASSTDPNVQTNSSTVTVVSPANQCGNRWRRLLQTSEDWQLYLLPFETFYQDVQPNRVTGPFDPSEFYQIAFGFGRDMTISLWIDEIFFYRNKPATTPTDADAGAN